VRKALTAAVVGAAAIYLLDPQQGRTRRAKLRDKLAKLSRRTAGEVSRRSEYARGQAEGLRHIGKWDSAPDNDPTLNAKVKSEAFSGLHMPKGRISVNSTDGVVELRGVCDSADEIEDLEQKVRKVTGVVEVHNFLHLPDTPAPNKQDVLDTS
jgi:osmotically-inducible protein OsmY